MSWENDFKRVSIEQDGFAPDYYYTNSNWMRFFRRLEKLGATIKIIDYDSAKIMLPEIGSYGRVDQDRETILLSLLQRHPSEVAKKGDVLTLSWNA